MSADLIFIGGNVITVDPTQPRAQAVAVVRDRIVAVGSDSEIRDWISPRTQVIDLKGRTLVPGFNDAHNHMIMFGQVLEQIDGAALTSMADLTQQVILRVRKAQPGAWIRSWGYDDTRLKEQRHPTRWDLDPVSPEHPTLIVRTCGHIAVANSSALALAGIDRNTPDPAGGRIDRDPVTGEPTGVLRENAKGLVERAVPRPTQADLVAAIARAQDVYLREGITSQQDMGTGNLTLPEELGAWQEARRSGILHVRSSVAIRYLRDFDTELRPPALLGTGLTSGFGDNLLRLGPLKYFMDGGIGGATAYLSQPYEHDLSTRGILCLEQPAVDALMEEAHSAGYQVAVHAIGDEAVAMIVKALERAVTRHARPNHRHRIEHAALTTPGMETQLKASGIVPVPQPPFLYHLGDAWLRNLGADRINWAFPLRRWLDAGLRFPLSSDRPVVYSSPLATIAAAVGRTSRSGVQLTPDQGITAEEAIRMHTLDAAFVTFEEEQKGSVTVGKLADFAVLGADPTQVGWIDIPQIPVVMTVIGGVILYMAL